MIVSGGGGMLSSYIGDLMLILDACDAGKILCCKFNVGPRGGDK